MSHSNRLNQTLILIAAISLEICNTSGVANCWAATTDTAAENDTPTSVPDNDSWPRQFTTAGGQEFTIYEPQVEKLKNNQLEQRSAVSVQDSTSEEPTFGVVWMKARTEVDKSSGLVNLEDIRFTKASFPSAPKSKSKFLAAIRENGPALLRPVSLERLQANIAVTHVEEKKSSAELKNDPPKIIYSKDPASLILIDGKPVTVPSGTDNIARVENTRALILQNQQTSKYYLSLGKKWLSSFSIDGPWKETNVPSDLSQSLENAKAAAIAQKQVDVTDDLTDVSSKVFVSTTPAELIQTQGTAQLEPVAETQLLYVKNTSGDIFLNTKDQNYYVLLSGRWYKSPSLEGNWNYVSADSLPADFSKIPETHPKGSVLASVAGTQQAQEAVIANQIPQTTTVDRGKPGEDVVYDGQPKFKAIDGTQLQYAENSPTPVIRVTPKKYYSVQNGIWFVSSQPEGPWIVADQVPQSIYSIPPSSPLYYTTYVYVYGHSRSAVYVGYLPGYLGSYVTPDGVVVYGTGYYYRPWVGSIWYGSPWTFGFGVGWGIGWGWGIQARPWWGPYRGVGWEHGPVWNRRVGYAINRTNIYGGWNHQVIRNETSPFEMNRTTHSFDQRRGGKFPSSTSTGHFNQTRPSGNNPVGQHRPNNVYADQNGNVYRHNGQNWEPLGRNNHSTEHGNGFSVPTGHPNAMVPRELDQARMGRELGDRRFEQGTTRRRNFPATGMGTSVGKHGGH